MKKLARIYKFGLYALCLGVLCSGPVNAQTPHDERPMVAVLEPVGNSRITPMHRMLARGTLEQYIVSSGSYRVVDRSRIDQVLQEQNFSRSDLVDASKAKELGQILQADIVCSSEMRMEGTYFIALASLIDVETAEVFASATEAIDKDTAAEVRKAIERAAMALVGVENPRRAQIKAELLQAAVEKREELEEAREYERMRADVTREALELAKAAREARPVSQTEINMARATYDRLSRNFTVVKGKKKNIVYKNNLLEKFEKTQGATYRNSTTPYGWSLLSGHKSNRGRCLYS